MSTYVHSLHVCVWKRGCGGGCGCVSERYNEREREITMVDKKAMAIQVLYYL